MVELLHHRFNHFFRFITSTVLVALVTTSILVPVPKSYAQSLDLPAPGVMLKLSNQYAPAMVKGIKIDPKNPLSFIFLIDPGQMAMSDTQKRQAYRTLVKYFLAALTTPEKDMWVNLSPYEHDRIISSNFGKTEMGNDLLAQDYLLKQLTASLIYPEDGLGRKFWDRVYKEVDSKFGPTQIPINTFNKVWIIPQSATVFEKGNVAIVIKARLKVLMEEDFLALDKHANAPKMGLSGLEPQVKAINSTTSQAMREVIIPAIEREINEGEHFAQLRQMYNSMILASWFKGRLKQHLLTRVYANKNKNAGVELQDPQGNELVFRQYVKAYKKGVYNYIKEERDPLSGETIPRKYFSGGGKFANLAMNASGSILKAVSTLSSDYATEAMDKEFDEAMINLSPAGHIVSQPGDTMVLNEATTRAVWGSKKPVKELEALLINRGGRDPARARAEAIILINAKAQENGDTSLMANAVDELAQSPIGVGRLSGNVAEEESLINALIALHKVVISQSLDVKADKVGNEVLYNRFPRLRSTVGILQILHTLNYAHIENPNLSFAGDLRDRLTLTAGKLTSARNQFELHVLQNLIAELNGIATQKPVYREDELSAEIVLTIESYRDLKNAIIDANIRKRDNSKSLLKKTKTIEFLFQLIANADTVQLEILRARKQKLADVPAAYHALIEQSGAIASRLYFYTEPKDRDLERLLGAEITQGQPLIAAGDIDTTIASINEIRLTRKPPNRLQAIDDVNKLQLLEEILHNPAIEAPARKVILDARDPIVELGKAFSIFIRMRVTRFLTAIGPGSDDIERILMDPRTQAINLLGDDLFGRAIVTDAWILAPGVKDARESELLPKELRKQLINVLVYDLKGQKRKEDPYTSVSPSEQTEKYINRARARLIRAKILLPEGKSTLKRLLLPVAGLAGAAAVGLMLVHPGHKTATTLKALPPKSPQAAAAPAARRGPNIPFTYYKEGGYLVFRPIKNTNDFVLCKIEDHSLSGKVLVPATKRVPAHYKVMPKSHFGDLKALVEPYIPLLLPPKPRLPANPKAAWEWYQDDNTPGAKDLFKPGSPFLAQRIGNKTTIFYNGVLQAPYTTYKISDFNKVWPAVLKNNRAMLTLEVNTQGHIIGPGIDIDAETARSVWTSTNPIETLAKLISQTVTDPTEARRVAFTLISSGPMDEDNIRLLTKARKKELFQLIFTNPSFDGPTRKALLEADDPIDELGKILSRFVIMRFLGFTSARGLGSDEVLRILLETDPPTEDLLDPFSLRIRNMWALPESEQAAQARALIPDDLREKLIAVLLHNLIYQGRENEVAPFNIHIDEVRNLSFFKIEGYVSELKSRDILPPSFNLITTPTEERKRKVSNRIVVAGTFTLLGGLWASLAFLAHTTSTTSHPKSHRLVAPAKLASTVKLPNDWNWFNVTNGGYVAINNSFLDTRGYKNAKGELFTYSPKGGKMTSHGTDVEAFESALIASVKTLELHWIDNGDGQFEGTSPLLPQTILYIDKKTGIPSGRTFNIFSADFRPTSQKHLNYILSKVPKSNLPRALTTALAKPIQAPITKPALVLKPSGAPAKPVTATKPAGWDWGKKSKNGTMVLSNPKYKFVGKRTPGGTYFLEDRQGVQLSLGTTNVSQFFRDLTSYIDSHKTTTNRAAISTRPERATNSNQAMIQFIEPRGQGKLSGEVEEQMQLINKLIESFRAYASDQLDLARDAGGDQGLLQNLAGLGIGAGALQILHALSYPHTTDNEQLGFAALLKKRLEQRITEISDEDHFANYVLANLTAKLNEIIRKQAETQEENVSSGIMLQIEGDIAIKNAIIRIAARRNNTSALPQVTGAIAFLSQLLTTADSVQLGILHARGQPLPPAAYNELIGLSGAIAYWIMSSNNLTDLNIQRLLNRNMGGQVLFDPGDIPLPIRTIGITLDNGRPPVREQDIPDSSKIELFQLIFHNPTFDAPTREALLSAADPIRKLAEILSEYIRMRITKFPSTIGPDADRIQDFLGPNSQALKLLENEGDKIGPRVIRIVWNGSPEALNSILPDELLLLYLRDVLIVSLARQGHTVKSPDGAPLIGEILDRYLFKTAIPALEIRGLLPLGFQLSTRPRTRRKFQLWHGITILLGGAVISGALGEIFKNKPATVKPGQKIIFTSSRETLNKEDYLVFRDNYNEFLYYNIRKKEISGFVPVTGTHAFKQMPDARVESLFGFVKPSIQAFFAPPWDWGPDTSHPGAFFATNSSHTRGYEDAKGRFYIDFKFGDGKWAPYEHDYLAFAIAMLPPGQKIAFDWHFDGKGQHTGKSLLLPGITALVNNKAGKVTAVYYDPQTKKNVPVSANALKLLEPRIANKPARVEKAFISKSSEDLGGIDFDDKYLEMNIEGDGKDMPIPKGFGWLLLKPITGFSPRIMEIHSGLGATLAFFSGLVSLQLRQAALHKLLSSHPTVLAMNEKQPGRLNEDVENKV